MGGVCDVCPLSRENDHDGDGICDNVDPCIDVNDLVLQGDIITVLKHESACTSISATLYEVADRGDLTFLTGEEIILGDGFKVLSGGVFEAAIGHP